MSHSGTSIVFRKRFSRGNRYNKKLKQVEYGTGALSRAIFALTSVCLKILFGLIFIAGISLGLIYGYRLITGSEYFALKKIEIIGNHHLTYGDIVSEGGLALGDNIFQINIDRLYWRLSRNPWIKSIYIRRELPDTIKINLTERRACFWVQENKDLFYADEMGERIAKVLPKKFVSLPLLYVDPGSRYSTQANQSFLPLSLLPTIVFLLDKKKFPFSWHDLAGIHLARLNRIEFFLEDPSLKVSLDIDAVGCPGGDKISALAKDGQKLALVWRDLRHRGELDRVDKIHVLQGQVWVGFKKKLE